MTTLPTTAKIHNLLALETITENDIRGLTPAERDDFNQTATRNLAELKGTERDHFLAKIDPILPPSTKQDIWEHNHTLINRTLAEYIGRNGVMPAKADLARKIGLSRQTIAKHFRDFRQHPEHAAEMEQFKFMAPNVLANVFKSALSGNIRAAKLYLDVVGPTARQTTGTVINGQNNNIQINNTILSQENLKHLSPEQLNEIENIIRKK